MALNKMQREKLSTFSKDELLDYIDLVQRNFWNLQNNWMMYMNNEYGEEAAVKADNYCFGGNSKVQMYRLKKMYDLKGDLQSLMDAMILSQLWVNCDYEIWKIDSKRLRLRVTNCYQQVRRVKDRVGELACKPAGLGVCDMTAKVINSAFDVKCIVCPPDEHPDNVWCEWEFELTGVYP